MTKVKVCGVTNYDDALLVTNLGAEYIGLNFVKDSPRKISVSMAKEIVSKLPPFVTPVGVFVDADPVEIATTARKCPLKIVQLHGSESPEYCAGISAAGLQVIKAFRVADEQSIAAIPAYSDAVQYVLLDACVPGEPGGTGETFNWDLALKAKELAGKPIFLAGGLTPENVGAAIEKVLPFAVDVASGVERLPRRKDFDKMKMFIRQARGL